MNMNERLRKKWIKEVHIVKMHANSTPLNMRKLKNVSESSGKIKTK